ncbi:MAG: hypothetical protein COC09_00635 [Gammaproteobacteria bacterium]|nr:hypothetical protein [Gammaproteobacteria bacterium]PCH65010.1 MAG: hypothetical protein COC09_00635 [Gammaproteobacteria bacterium]
MVLPKGQASVLALHFDNEKHGRGQGVLHYRAFSDVTRISRAVLLLTYCWVIAALTVPIFILHWLTVPGFLMGGIILCVQQLRSKIHVEHAVGHCPVHGAEVDIHLEASQRPPVWVHCPQCHASLHLIADLSHQEFEQEVG